ncbi:hypothetical protein F1D05_09495 [Kribbella qitaiheensis]|uniref:Uncharacterized protein n=1 Tax=Kribbella qitaiheensis TaxID=1544730 RepID=A0A7G6WVR2_9ACTN|nr:hypothetical protein [Kribbella qitaiheensis]QNE18077.1 hypothetical protein F1D05_09495 [Kribbella qitaiheensis]
MPALALQAMVGNRATSRALAGAVSVQRANEAAPGKVDQAADDLYGWLVAVSLNLPSLLLTLLLQQGHQSELETKYQEKYKRALRDDLKSKLSWADGVRAQCYLDYGKLRPADKIYIAIHGVLTDEATVVRLAPVLHAERESAESEFTASYSKDYGTDYKLPNGSNSRIAGAIMQETLWATFAQRFRIAAVIAFGKPRAADDIKIATVSGTNDAALLFDALQRQDPKQIAADFAAAYESPIKEYLSKETSLHTKQRALMFFEEGVAPEDRLIRTVEIGTSGYTTADTDFIFDAATHATAGQVANFVAAVKNKDPRLKHIDDTLGGMNKEDRDRLNAMVGLTADSAQLADPVVVRLRQLGGNGLGSVFLVLRNAEPVAHDVFRKSYADANSPFRRYVDQYTVAAEKGWLLSYVFTDLRPRLNYVLTNPGNDEYVLFLLNSFASAAERKALATDADFGAKVAGLGTATQNKIQLLLEPAHLTPAERAVWIDAAVKRETSSGAGSLTGAAGALEDENRELQAAVARAGKNPTAAQQAEIDRLTAATTDALDAFVKYRDELEAAVAGALEMAAGLVATVMTGGVASVEMALAAVARAAVASAMAKVVANKLARGDRFDVVGADGAHAFVSGAVDGMLNAVAPVVANGAATSALTESAGLAARSAAPGAFRQFAATTGPKMVEGAVVGGLSSAVDTATRDQTWAEGFDRGMRKVLTSAVQNALTSGALAGLPAAVQSLAAAYGGLDAFESMINALPEAEAFLEEGTFGLGAAPAAAPPVQRTGPLAPPNWGSDFEDFATVQIDSNQLGGKVPKMDILVSGQIRSNQGIDRIGFHLDENNELHIYHFEMKWNNAAVQEKGKPPPSDPRATLTKTKTRGWQGSEEWSAFAITEFCNGVTPQAAANRDILRAALPKKLGLPKGTIWTPTQLSDYMLANLKKTKRVVVVPDHVNIKKLWMQLIAMTRGDLRKNQIVKAKLP